MQIKRQLSARQTVNRSGKCTGAKLNYQVSVPDNLDRRSEALELVRSTAPAYVGNARKQTVELVKIPGNGTYEFEVNYAAPEPIEEKQGNERIWTFEIRKQTVRVFDARELVQTVPGNANTVPPNPGNRIGWDGRSDGDSKVEGALMIIPEIREICVATYRQSRINAAFRKKLFALAGKLNSTAFHNWAPGEVLLESAVQSDPFTNTSGRDLVDITYTFAVRPVQNIKINGVTINPVSMWNPIWTISRRDTVNNAIVNCGVYESRIYDYGNFAPLDI